MHKRSFMSLLGLLFSFCVGCDFGRIEAVHDMATMVPNLLEDGQIQCVNSQTPKQKLSETCYQNLIADNQFSATNFQEFEPQYPLYSDGMHKERRIYIPPQAKVKTDQLDAWEFPVGTILYKDFFLANGKKVETRVLEKVSFQSNDPQLNWTIATYAWDTNQNDAYLVTDNPRFPPVGVRTEAELNSYPLLYTSSECNRCHQSSNDEVFGFNALQLSNFTKKGNFTYFNDHDLFTTKMNGPVMIPGSELDQSILGYVSSNCATCHSPNGVMGGTFDASFNYDAKSVRESNFYKTTVSLMGGYINPRSPSGSLLYIRFSTGSMPPRTSVPDTKSIDLLKSWINSL